jgi:hypothetical protein
VSPHLPRIRNWDNWLRSYVQVGAIEKVAEKLKEAVYLLALSSFVPATVDVLVTVQGEKQLRILMGLSVEGQNKGLWTPFGERMFRGDEMPQSRAQQIMKRLGLDLHERRFDPIDAVSSMWRTAHYLTIVTELRLTQEEADRICVNDEYAAIRIFTLEEAMRHVEIPEAYRYYVSNLRRRLLH